MHMGFPLAINEQNLFCFDIISVIEADMPIPISHFGIRILQSVYTYFHFCSTRWTLGKNGTFSLNIVFYYHLFSF